MKLIEQVKRHEGFRAKPYRCTAGKLTIGYGLNLEDRGLTETEAETILVNDLSRIYDHLAQKLHWFSDMKSERRDVLVNMAFNIGVSGLLKFKKALYYMELGDYDKAADEMLDSRWAMQVPSRSKELAEQMRTGEYQ